MSVRNDRSGAVSRARVLRRGMTALERALWYRIRNEQIGFRFRRQYPATPHYILDFYCASAKVCVEIDGPLHEPDRDALLEEYGILTLRFSSDEVFADILPVVERIRQECETRRSE